MYVERREKLLGDLSEQTQTANVVIPVGGGSTASTVTFTFGTGVDLVLSVLVTNTSPISSSFAAQLAGIHGNIVGMTLSASIGTTLGIQVVSLGH